MFKISACLHIHTHTHIGVQLGNMLKNQMRVSFLEEEQISLQLEKMQADSTNV